MSVFRPPDEIINSLNSGKLALFIGHDLDSEECSIPSLASLAGNIVERVEGWRHCQLCSEEGACTRQGKCLVSFTKAATLYRHNELSSIVPLMDFLHEQLQVKHSPTRLFQLIAQLPLKVIVTTAYDQRLQQALRAVNKQYHQTSTDLQIIARESVETQIIHLYGLLSEPDSLILTEADHASLQDQKRLVCIWLQGLLATHTCLFLDVDFDNPYLQILYNPIIQKLGVLRRQPYIVLTHPSRFPAIDIDFHRLDTSPLKLLQALKKHVSYKPVLSPPLPMPPAPYKFLDHFRVEDRAIFVGRDFEIHELKNRIITRNLTVLFAYSGMGKTSLLRAGIIPALQIEGFQVQHFRLSDNPIEMLGSSAKKLEIETPETPPHSDDITDIGQVLIIDQVEELFTLHTDMVRREFVELLASSLGGTDSNRHFVLSLRTEYLGQLEDLFSGLGHSNLLENRFRLGPLKPEDARYAIEKPATLFKFSIDDKLTEAILDHLGRTGFEPSQLQIICYQLYQDATTLEPEGSTFLSFSRYQKLGEATGILAGFLDSILEKIGGTETKANLEVILKNMITFERTKAILSWEEITRRVEYASLRAEDVKGLLWALQKYRIVRTLETGEYELAHDVLVKKIWTWLDDIDIARLNAVQSLRQAVEDFRKSYRLMAEDKLIAVQQAAGAIAFSAEELVLLLISSLSASQFGQPKYWVNRIKTQTPLHYGDDLHDQYQRNHFDEVLKILREIQELRLPHLHEQVLRAEVLLAPSYVRQELNWGIRNSFSLDEIRELALYLGVDIEQLKAADKLPIILELITYFIEDSRVDFLLSAVRSLRPHILGKYTITPPPPSDEYELFRLLITMFSFGELKELISRFQIRLEILALSDSIKDLSHQLVAFVKRQHRLDHLRLLIAHLRPHSGLDVVIEAHKILNEKYDTEQLRTLCFDLSLDHEDFGYGNKAQLAEQLSLYMSVHARMDDLINAIMYPEQVGRDRFKGSLRRILVDRMDDEQFKMLCYDLDINPYNIPGRSLTTKIRELILYATRRAILSNLLHTTMKRWAEILPEHEVWDLLRMSVRERDFTLNILQTAFGERETPPPDAWSPSQIDERLPESLFLAELLQKYFSTEYEFWDLCFDLGVDYEEMPGQSLDIKQLELVKYLIRHGRLLELKSFITSQYPDLLIEWEPLRDTRDNEEE